MQIHIYETPELAAKAAAALIAAAILDKPNMVLGLPTGSSPVNTYKELAKMNREGVVDFSRVTTYNLDEYVGLEGTHEQSYRYFMNANLFDHVNIDKANTHVPCGVGDDPEKNARDYEAAIEKAGGIDLQFMGIGRNGHIGFNEPADAFPDATLHHRPDRQHHRGQQALFRLQGRGAAPRHFHGRGHDYARPPYAFDRHRRRQGRGRARHGQGPGYAPFARQRLALPSGLRDCAGQGGRIASVNGPFCSAFSQAGPARERLVRAARHAAGRRASNAKLNPRPGGLIFYVAMLYYIMASDGPSRPSPPFEKKKVSLWPVKTGFSRRPCW